MQSVRDAGHDITGKNITVMGVGGASMAICAQSALDGAASVHIFARRTSRYWNRTQKFAENLSAKQVVRSASSTMMIILHCEIPLHRVIC